LLQADYWQWLARAWVSGAVFQTLVEEVERLETVMNLFLERFQRLFPIIEHYFFTLTAYKV
jgi:hypothetical protein